ncbi:YfbM family protein [Leptothrix ochracea]|jgi:hypothetical protein|uniref:YfbM family protein n=1 Tax=Leptothrix ochracea TaxID=735331 RepID=UPI0034E22114
MLIRQLLAIVIFMFGLSSANASLVWSAVAVDPNQIQRLKSDNDFFEVTFDSAPKDRSVYLDKAWHGIHYLLTGSSTATATLASKVIFGGESFGPDQGYGQAQLLTPTEVKAIAALLTTETPERLAARYEPKALERSEIYPSVIWVREGKEALDYVLTFYRKLVKFYQQAAERGDAVIFAVN